MAIIYFLFFFFLAYYEEIIIILTVYIEAKIKIKNNNNIFRRVEKSN